MNEFNRASNEFKAQIEQEIAHLEVENTADDSAAQPQSKARTAGH